MSDSGPVRFSRRPYTVTYMDLKGEKQTLRRRPPEKLHDMLPTDIVSLTRQKSADFLEGDEFEVKHINPKHPNVMQLIDEDDRTTFVDFYDAKLEEMVAPRNGIDPRDRPERNEYLLWP